MTVDVAKHDALIVVDVQNDFCAGGALAVPDGDAVVPVINALVDRFSHVTYTRDWHPPDHCSFAEEPEFVDKSWPPHCVADTHGAAFHPELHVRRDAPVIDKGTDRLCEAYSGFDETSLAQQLKGAGISRAFVCGLATDYCVKATALDAVAAGFETVVIADACRAVDIPEGNGESALAEMRAAGVQLVLAQEIAT